VGAAIYQSVEHSARENPAAIALGQTTLAYIDAVYFIEVILTACGMGDIFPITDDGRGFVFAWAFVGAGIYGVIIGGLVIKITNYLYVNVLMSSYNDVKRRQIKRRATEPPSAEREQKEDEKQAARLEPMESKVLPWYYLLFLVLIGLIGWACTHNFYAGVFYGIECCMGNAGNFTSNTYGNYFYMAFISSQTMCFGDYTPKTTEGRAFWIVFHQVIIMSNVFLFVTVTLCLLKWIDDKSFWAVGKLVTRVKRKTLQEDASEADSESSSDSPSGDNGDAEDKENIV